MSEAEYRYLTARLAELARPRLTGTPGAEVVEGRLREELERLGYEVREIPFSLALWPTRYALPLVASLYLTATLRAASRLLAGQMRSARRLLLTTPLLVLGASTGLRALTTHLPWGKIGTANLLAYPIGGRPRYLVVAHRDSKSQPISTAARSLSILTSIITWTTLTAMALALQDRKKWEGQRGRRRRALGWQTLTRMIARTTIVAGGNLLRCTIGNESPGALDNGSGLVALLGIARRERGEDDIAFLLTDAEELGLVGARAAAGWLPDLEGIINLDGLDDEGDFYLIDRRLWPRGELAPHLADLIEAAADMHDWSLERRRLPLGVLADHLPLARAGQPAVTLMHGTRDSLRRVHLPTDDTTRLRGRGIERAVELITTALQISRLDPKPIAPERLLG